VSAVRTARALSYPRFLIAADPHAGAVSLRPVFIGALDQIAAPTPAWREPHWVLPDGISVTGGTFVFAADGAWVGLVIGRGGATRLVPAASVIAMADWLVKEGPTQPGWLGIEVEPLSDTVAAAAGATAGVTVTWVDPRSRAAGQLRAGDVIERVEESPVTTLEDWTALVSRLGEGEAVAIGARRAGELVEGQVVAIPPPGPITRPLGLTLRTIRRIGAEVVRVDPGSAAAAAGLRPGDVITVVGDVEQPTAPQVTRTLAAASRERPVILAFTRGSSHHVVALERNW
jgi:S1-C subfamily serine protease